MNPIIFADGHRKEVLCIDSNSQRLISGGECGEIALWDKAQLVRCVSLPSEEDVSSLCFSKKTDSNDVYGSSGNAVFMLDLRNTKNPVWSEECMTDDINQVCINEENDHLALANDTNHVCLMDLSTKNTRYVKNML